MDHMMRFVQTRLKQRKQYHQAVALVIKEYLKGRVIDPSTLQIKITPKYCTLVLGMNEDKTKRFLQKNALLEQINTYLGTHGRELVIKDLRIA